MSDETSNDRVDLKVPFPEKDDAKALGARWDPDRRIWFVPPGVDPSRFARGSPGPAHLSSEPSASARVDLDVPFEEKDEAKSKGARWDPAAKRWFAPPGVDLKPLQAWIPGTGEDLTEQIPPIFVVESSTPCWKCGRVTPVGTIASESFVEPGDASTHTRMSTRRTGRLALPTLRSSDAKVCLPSMTLTNRYFFPLK